MTAGGADDKVDGEQVEQVVCVGCVRCVRLKSNGARWGVRKSKVQEQDR